MKFLIIWAIIGDFTYFWMAIKDFKKSDRGIKKVVLSNKNREKWQRNNAILELGIALFGLGIIYSLTIKENKAIFIICASVCLCLFALTIVNDHLIKKQ